MAIKAGFEPADEIHHASGRRHADVAQVAGAIASRNVHAAAKSDGEVRVITANAGFLLENLPVRFGAARVFIAK